MRLVEKSVVRKKFNKNLQYSVAKIVNFHVHFETLGCRLNQSESEGAAHFFLNSGFSVSMQNLLKFVQKSKIVIFNTCAVTENAEKKAKKMISLSLKKNPDCVLIVTGCFAERNPNEIQKIDSRIAVLKGRFKSLLAFLPKFFSTLENPLDFYSAEKLAFLIRDFFESKIFESETFKSSEAKKIAQNSNDFVNADAFLLFSPDFLKHSRPVLKIQDGCNRNCSYCAIKNARGKSISLSEKQILSRIQEISENSFCEIVLTGVNLADFAGQAEFDEKKINFSTLLKNLLNNERTKNVVFRLSSLNPKIVLQKNFSTVILSPRVRPFFHLSIQSASDEILQKMQRDYKKSQIFEAINVILKAKPKAFLACDVIVGFPGESDEDFLQTFEFCQKIGFAKIHVFPFSARPGTLAQKMQAQIPPKKILLRCKMLENLSNKNFSLYASQFFGKTLDAICESSNSCGKKIRAVTENFLHCELSLSNLQKEKIPRFGEKIRVKILGEIPNQKSEWKICAELRGNDDLHD